LQTGFSHFKHLETNHQQAWKDSVKQEKDGGEKLGKQKEKKRGM
jgi:hypothetical protein